MAHRAEDESTAVDDGFVKQLDEQYLREVGFRVFE